MTMLNKAGRFNVRVLYASNYIGESGKGTVYVGLPFEVIDGPEQGQHITGYLYISDNALDRSIETLAECFGFNGDLNALYNGETSLEGYECSITTDMETYEGRERCKVQWINPLGSGGNGMKAASAEKFNSILSRLGGRAKAIAEAELKGMPARPQPTDAAAAGTDDNLPF